MQAVFAARILSLFITLQGMGTIQQIWQNISFETQKTKNWFYIKRNTISFFTVNAIITQAPSACQQFNA
jgi:hypothetical protein